MLNQRNLKGIEIKQNIRKDFNFIRELGQGQEGVIFLARNKINQELRAIKAIAKEKLDGGINSLEKEIQLFRQLDHPNILKLFEIYESAQTIYLVQEYCEGGDLFQLIAKNKYLPEDKAAIIMKQLFHVVAYCHSKHICHRDLKPENFLLKYKDDISLIKLTDFGISKELEEGEIMTEPKGTPFYLAPEIIKGNYGYEVDNWALGVILYIMIFGRPPFYGNNTENIILAIKTGKIHFSKKFCNYSNEVKDLIESLLSRKPTKRCNAQQAYLHPWIQEKNTTKNRNPIADSENQLSREEQTNIFSVIDQQNQGDEPLRYTSLASNQSIKELERQLEQNSCIKL